METNFFTRGFLKSAQENETEIAQPEERDNETILTCMSDCTYAQNPEKKCMLENVSLSMGEKSGSFTCGQYVQMQEMQQPDLGANNNLAPTKEPTGQEALAKKQPGLPGVPGKQ